MLKVLRYIGFLGVVWSLSGPESHGMMGSDSANKSAESGTARRRRFSQTRESDASSSPLEAPSPVAAPSGQRPKKRPKVRSVPQYDFTEEAGFYSLASEDSDPEVVAQSQAEARRKRRHLMQRLAAHRPPVEVSHCQPEGCRGLTSQPLALTQWHRTDHFSERRRGMMPDPERLLEERGAGLQPLDPFAHLRPREQLPSLGSSWVIFRQDGTHFSMPAILRPGTGQIGQLLPLPPALPLPGTVTISPNGGRGRPHPSRIVWPHVPNK